MATPSGGGGPFAALKNIAATLLATGQTRIELLGNEIEMQKQRALHQLLLMQALMFCIGVGVVLAVVALAVQFPEHRTPLLGGVAVLFFVVGGLVYSRLRRSQAESEPLFAASLAELQEDLRQLKAASADHAPKNPA